MTLIAVEGPAGSGKTFQLIRALTEQLAARPLREGQRVLAVTFMHGAKLRLHEKLRAVPGLRRSIDCVTVDSFAQRLLRRWRGLATALGFPEFALDQYDEQCDAAGVLLERPEVSSWVAASFPIVLIDEAQDLRPQRLRMIVPLSAATTVLIAADEFQCLDSTLRPNPAVDWLRGACQPTVLDQVRRTNVAGLLNAAAAIRNGDPPVSNRPFVLMNAASVPQAATFLANAIAWRNGGNVAIITPSLSGNFVRDCISRVTQQPCGKQNNGPYSIGWDRSEQDEVASLTNGLTIGDNASPYATVAALRELQDCSAVRNTIAWVYRQVRTRGVVSFSRAQVFEVIGRQVVTQRQRVLRSEGSFTAMTIQQAKNREFDGVVVLWPYQVGGDEEHKRRLLYNAITRARRWCTVVAQGSQMPATAPFR